MRCLWIGRARFRNSEGSRTGRYSSLLRLPLICFLHSDRKLISAVKIDADTDRGEGIGPITFQVLTGPVLMSEPSTLITSLRNARPLRPVRKGSQECALNVMLYVDSATTAQVSGSRTCGPKSMWMRGKHGSTFSLSFSGGTKATFGAYRYVTWSGSERRNLLRRLRNASEQFTVIFTQRDPHDTQAGDKGAMGVVG